MNVNFTPEALSDLKHIHTYIAEFDPSAADRVISRIRQVTQIFENFPLLGREGLVKDTREFAVTGLPYTIIYKITSPTDIDILTVIHQRRQYPPEEQDE
ncbi:type II toxin-antitoxin system RelE/ParE family toxin [Pararhizobium sp. IMCC21322]|uniref:type II toxin-antitoxin system RelE/ParE family toxin n=1 Tax=Pararhizobium sp. IMCC21322 TaxID=3067903 RepID=UPI002741D231|nr:type II toxin-antitoxin system RelE/ParE family toxin [Pararhizobium sp. IMCC21322]